MRTAPLALAALAFALAPPSAAQVAESRFDVQTFRPAAGPQDLVMVQQSRPLANLSAAGGLYLNYSLDPLVLVPVDGQQKALSVILGRVQLDAMAVIGLFDWAEIGVAAPVVLFQSSDNLEAIGTEGSLRSFAMGDLRLTGKLALPYLRRTSGEQAGFGAALTFGVGLPTGPVDAFAGDGAVTSTTGLVLDYRFESGLLLALNAGVWLRPEREFQGALLGNMGSLRFASEIPVVRSYGLTAIAEVSSDVGLEKLADKSRQFPTELMAGLRWYGSPGLTLTVGGGLGCGCGLGSPSFRTFASAVWVPGVMREQEQIERFKRPPVDADGDGLIGERDRCPDVAGPVENNGCPDEDGDGVLGSADRCPLVAGPAANNGCPDEDGDGVFGVADLCPHEEGSAENNGCPDRDRDGVVDRLDRCPDEPAPNGGVEGCPLARIRANKIVILEQVHFATNQDVILPESFPTLQEVAQILKDHPEIQHILVEGHTDFRASDSYNKNLSERRAASVMKFLLDTGIKPSRITSHGFGRSMPIASNDTEAGMALNRRVEFTISSGAEAQAYEQKAYEVKREPGGNVISVGNKVVLPATDTGKSTGDAVFNGSGEVIRASDAVLPASDTSVAPANSKK